MNKTAFSYFMVLRKFYNWKQNSLRRGKSNETFSIFGGLSRKFQDTSKYLTFLHAKAQGITNLSSYTGKIGQNPNSPLNMPLYQTLISRTQVLFCSECGKFLWNKLNFWITLSKLRSYSIWNHFVLVAVHSTFTKETLLLTSLDEA